MNVKHLLGIALACLPFFFACQAKEQPAQPEKSVKVQTVKPRHLTKAEFLVQAHEINHARTSFIEGMKGTMADYEIVSIKETPIMDVFPYVEKGGGQ